MASINHRSGTTDEPVPSAWSLSLLGAWRLAKNGAAVDVGGNGQRLFALLALRGASERPYLAGLLWPRCSDAHAHGNLRATLSRLHRRQLTEVLYAAGGVLSLRPEVAVDAHTVQATASAVLDGTIRSPDWRTVRLLDDGELLAGWYEEWVLYERERLQQLCLHALEVLSGQLLAAGNGRVALIAAQAAVAVEPLRESAHRAVIEAHLASGNRGEALLHLHRLRHLLRDELGVEPSGPTVELLR